MTYPVVGAIKPDGSGGWYVLNDAAHEPLGGLVITSVTSQSITVFFDPGSKIHKFVVTTDDVLGKLHYTCGASADLDHAVIFLANDNGQVDPRRITNKSANLWIDGLLSA